MAPEVFGNANDRVGLEHDRLSAKYPSGIDFPVSGKSTFQNTTLPPPEASGDFQKRNQPPAFVNLQQINIGTGPTMLALSTASTATNRLFMD